MRIGTPLVVSLIRSRTRPPRATVAPLWIAMVLSSLRCWMVGESMFEVVVSTASLTSCTTSRITSPPALTRGVTVRMTPVSRWSTSLTVGASESVLLTEDRVVTGT